MLFDSTIIQTGFDLAAHVHGEYPQYSPLDLRDIILGLFSGVPLLDKPHCEVARNACRVPEIVDPQKKILTLIAALSELDRLTGWRKLPPIEVVDLMSHVLPGSQKIPVICHGERTIQFAAWFGILGQRVIYRGEEAVQRHLAALTGAAVTEVTEIAKVTKVTGATEIPIATGLANLESTTGAGGSEHLKPIHSSEPVRHIAILDAPGDNHEMGEFLRQFIGQTGGGAVLLTNWSFLSTTSPGALQSKQRLVENSLLQSVIQLPKGIISRSLPALLQLSLGAVGRPVRLVNASDWAVPSRHGLEISYLDPILSQACNLPIGRLPRWTPKPPAADVDAKTLMEHGCDLRLKPKSKIHEATVGREEQLGGCAALVRGQMLTKASSNETAYEFREVALADIDGHGFVVSASRVVADAAPLPRSRRVARLCEGDILLACKGALQSLGRVGIVTSCGNNWLPSQTFYLIRAESVDPIWLFYYLKSTQAVEYLRSHISGTSIPQIRVADIAALPVPIPTESSLKAIHDIHSKSLRLIRRIEKLQHELDDLMTTADLF